MKRSVAVVGMALLCAVGFFGLNTLNQPKGFDPDGISDPTEYLTGVPADTVVATVNGEPISAEEYFYWVGYTAETTEYYMSGKLDWTAQEGEGTVLDYVKSTALEAAKLYRVVETMANEKGCGLTEAQMAENDARYENLVAQLGGERKAKMTLLEVGQSKEGFLKINSIPALYSNLLDTCLKVEPATAEEMEDYIAANDILKAKHILLMTMDPNTRQPLSEEQQAAKKEQAEEVYAQLQESEEPLALFDELMNRYSEDTGLAANPDGYTFTANQMVAEFEQGTRDLEYNEISGIIESDYGYHIILRLNPADEAFAADLGQLLGETEAQEKMDVMLSDALAEAEVETAEVYDGLDLPAYYSNLKLLREEMAAAEAELAAAKE